MLYYIQQGLKLAVFSVFCGKEIIAIFDTYHICVVDGEFRTPRRQLILRLLSSRSKKEKKRRKNMIVAFRKISPEAKTSFH